MEWIGQKIDCPVCKKGIEIPIPKKLLIPPPLPQPVAASQNAPATKQNVTGRVLGILFGIFALYFVTDSIFAALAVVGAVLLLLPQFREMVYRKTQAIIPRAFVIPLGIALVVAGVVVAISVGGGHIVRTDAKSKRDEAIRSQFSPWDGSHYRLEKYIKDNLNDPDSYKHVETRCIDKGDYLVVITKYRGKNAFGAVVTEIMTAKVDLSTNNIEIIR